MDLRRKPLDDDPTAPPMRRSGFIRRYLVLRHKLKGFFELCQAPTVRADDVDRFGLHLLMPNVSVTVGFSRSCVRERSIVKAVWTFDQRLTRRSRSLDASGMNEPRSGFAGRFSKCSVGMIEIAIGIEIGLHNRIRNRDRPCHFRAGPWSEGFRILVNIHLTRGMEHPIINKEYPMSK